MMKLIGGQAVICLAQCHQTHPNLGLSIIYSKRTGISN
jgi:hypothetical protein